MLENLRALVEFAQAGSIAGAADRLFQTPSALTRQVQRLEAALGAELLDGSVKRPRLSCYSLALLPGVILDLVKYCVPRRLTCTDPSR